jgi:transposase InsO family protein
MKAVTETATAADGIDIEGLPGPKRPCSACTIRKAHQNIRRDPALHRSSAEGELLHVDIGGGSKLPRALGSQGRYWLAAIDDYSGWCTVKFLRHKSAAKHALKEIITKYERDRQVQVREIHSVYEVMNKRIGISLRPKFSCGWAHG